MIHLAFYVPKTHLEVVKEAVFKAGAGRIGNYDYCSFEIEGLGQFRPLKGSQPFLGNQDKIEKVLEVKVEVVCEENLLQQIVESLKAAHPYETPAYYAIKMLG